MVFQIAVLQNLVRRSLVLLIVSLFWCGLTATLWAQDSEVKILDSSGLIRAVRILRSKAIVEINVRSDLGEDQVVLEAIDQAVSEVVGDRTGDVIKFRGVTPGIWRLSLGSADLLRVRIYEAAN